MATPPTAATEVLPARRPWRRGVAVAAATGVAAGVAAVIALVAGDSSPPERAGADTAPSAARRSPGAMPYDFDGDRHQELVFGMPDAGRSAAGAALVRSGYRKEKSATVIQASTADLARPFTGTEEFGAGIASGDFDHDGWTELAISAPGRNVVAVFAGSPSGLRTRGARKIRASEIFLPSGYGTRIVAADMNRDGFDDLVVGAPWAERGSGTVRIHFGGETGLHTDDSRTITRPRTDPAAFGGAIRAGDVDHDGNLDLVEGAPDRQQPGHASFCPGSKAGPRGCAPLGRETASGTSSLALADVDDDGYADIVQGDAVEEEPLPFGQQPTGGEVRLWLGTRSGPARDPISITQASSDVAGRNQAGDAFGASVAAGDLDGDGHDDIVVGAPGEDAGAGAVSVIRGGRDGIAQAGHTRFEKGQGIPGVKAPGERLGDTVAVLKASRDDRLDVVVTAPGVDRLANAAYVLDGGRGAFAPGETRVWQPLRGIHRVSKLKINRIRIARGA